MRAKSHPGFIKAGCCYIGLCVWCFVSLAICRPSICLFFPPSICLSESDCATWKMNSVKRVPRTPLIPHLQELDLIATWSQLDFITLATIKSASFESRCSLHPQHCKLRCWRMLIFGIWARCHMCSPAAFVLIAWADFFKPLWHCSNYHLRYSLSSESVLAKFFLHWSLQPALEAGSEITIKLQIKLGSMNKAGNKVATYPLTSISECPVCDSYHQINWLLCKSFMPTLLGKGILKWGWASIRFLALWSAQNQSAAWVSWAAWPAWKIARNIANHLRLMMLGRYQGQVEAQKTCLSKEVGEGRRRSNKSE